MTLRARVALALVLAVVPLVIVLAFLGMRTRRNAVLESTHAATIARMESGGRERCEERANAPADDDELGTEVPERPVGRRGARRARRREAPLGRGGALVAAYDVAFHGWEEGTPTLPSDVRAALEDGEPAVLVPHGAGSARVAVRMPWDEGPCVIVVVEPRRGAALGERAATRDLVYALVALVVAVIAAMLALGPVLRRIGLLSSALRASQGAGRLELPPAVRGRDEVGELATALENADRNAAEHVSRLEARDRALRDYVDGTTHDLAIPLTVLSGHLSSMVERAREGAAPDPRDVSGAVAASQYLGQLSANLAAAARLDGHAPLVRGDVDLGVLATRVVDRLSPIARHKHVEVACSVPERAAIVVGDELLVERALANLVHNAIRHRPAATEEAPGHVAVIVENEEGRALVRVLGDGARVSDALLETLRKGEVPADPARTRGRGLGLAIVRQVAAAHSMTVAFERAEEGGLEVRLAAPA